MHMLMAQHSRSVVHGPGSYHNVPDSWVHLPSTCPHSLNAEVREGALCPHAPIFCGGTSITALQGVLSTGTLPEREEFLLIVSMEGKYLSCQSFEQRMRENFTRCVQGAASLLAGKCLWASLPVLRQPRRHTHLQMAIGEIAQTGTLAHEHSER